MGGVTRWWPGCLAASGRSSQCLGLAGGHHGTLGSTSRPLRTTRQATHALRLTRIVFLAADNHFFMHCECADRCASRYRKHLTCLRTRHSGL